MKHSRTLSKQVEDDYFKLIRVSTVWNNNYIGYESICDRNKKMINKRVL